MNLKTAIAIILLPLIIYLFSFFSLFSDTKFYKNLFEKNNVDTRAENISIKLIDYFNYKSSILEVSEFNKEETTHMAEVKSLITKIKIFFVLLILAFVSVILFCEEKSKVFFYGGIITILLPLIFYILPFDYIFVLFHKIFFVGKWQFPAESFMIQIFPEQFFYDFTFSIFLRGLISGFIVLLLSKFDKLYKIIFQSQQYL